MVVPILVDNSNYINYKIYIDTKIYKHIGNP